MYEKPTQISSTEEFILNLQVQKLRLALPIGPKWEGAYITLLHEDYLWFLTWGDG